MSSLFWITNFVEEWCIDLPQDGHIHNIRGKEKKHWKVYQGANKTKLGKKSSGQDVCDFSKI